MPTESYMETVFSQAQVDVALISAERPSVLRQVELCILLNTSLDKKLVCDYLNILMLHRTRLMCHLHEKLITLSFFLNQARPHLIKVACLASNFLPLNGFRKVINTIPNLCWDLVMIALPLTVNLIFHPPFNTKSHRSALLNRRSSIRKALLTKLRMGLF